MPQRPSTVLCTAFEPSGDDLGAAVIAALKARRPGTRVYAVGGPGMEAAGATMIERTGEHAEMGLPGLGTIVDHMELNDRVDAWLATHPIDLHVPIDSPAANFPICALTKPRGAKVVHVVAPQMWAWGSWRVRKLRRLTDLVLCLLPFEPAWFRTRGVPAEFIGHPMFDAPLPPPRDLGAGAPKIAVLPGSRPREFDRVLPLQLEVLRHLRAEHPGLRAVLAAVSEGSLEHCRRVAAACGGWPDSLSAEVGDVDAVLSWADLALACSGTVTLRTLRHRTSMVVMYRVDPIGWNLIGKWLLNNSFRALPNLAAQRAIVPEYVPLEGPAAPVIAAAERLLSDPAAMDAQRSDLDAVAQSFEQHRAAEDAAAHLCAVLDR